MPTITQTNNTAVQKTAQFSGFIPLSVITLLLSAIAPFPKEKGEHKKRETISRQTQDRKLKIGLTNKQSVICSILSAAIVKKGNAIAIVNTPNPDISIGVADQNKLAVSSEDGNSSKPPPINESAAGAIRPNPK